MFPRHCQWDVCKATLQVTGGQMLSWCNGVIYRQRQRGKQSRREPRVSASVSFDNPKRNEGRSMATANGTNSTPLCKGKTPGGSLSSPGLPSSSASSFAPHRVVIKVLAHINTHCPRALLCRGSPAVPPPCSHWSIRRDACTVPVPGRARTAVRPTNLVSLPPARISRGKRRTSIKNNDSALPLPNFVSSQLSIESRSHNDKTVAFITQPICYELLRTNKRDLHRSTWPSRVAVICNGWPHRSSFHLPR